MEKITMSPEIFTGMPQSSSSILIPGSKSPEIFSGYTNPYPKNMKKVLWAENINGQEPFVKS